MQLLSILVFFLLAVSAFGQQPNPQTATPQQAPPQQAAPESKDLELNTAMMESTFMIEGHVAQGTTIGTVFIVGRPLPGVPPRGRYVLITAAHVLEEMQGDTAVLHLRRKTDDKTNTWIDAPIVVPIRTNNQPLWMRHPEADVAVMYIAVPSEDVIPLLPTTLLADDTMLTDYEVKPGDELRCLGYPLRVSSNAAGFPVLRSGRIASYPLLPTDKTKTFLLDLRVFKGNSGGPVFFVERNRVVLGTLGQYKGYHFLMGLISQEVLYPEQVIGPYSQELRQTQLGLAVVVHASLIKRTLEMLPPPTL
jgi:S1-C subfamily serine protease